MLMSFRCGTAQVVFLLSAGGTGARGCKGAILGFFDRLFRVSVSFDSYEFGSAASYLGPSRRWIESYSFQLPSFSVTSVGSLQCASSIGFSVITSISALFGLQFFFFLNFSNVLLCALCELINSGHVSFGGYVKRSLGGVKSHVFEAAQAQIGLDETERVRCLVSVGG